MDQVTNTSLNLVQDVCGRAFLPQDAVRLRLAACVCEEAFHHTLRKLHSNARAQDLCSADVQTSLRFTNKELSLILNSYQKNPEKHDLKKRKAEEILIDLHHRFRKSLRMTLSEASCCTPWQRDAAHLMAVLCLFATEPITLMTNIIGEVMKPDRRNVLSLSNQVSTNIDTSLPALTQVLRELSRCASHY